MFLVRSHKIPLEYKKMNAKFKVFWKEINSLLRKKMKEVELEIYDLKDQLSLRVEEKNMI